MLQRFFLRIPPLFWMTLVLVATVAYFWHLQQPQFAVEVDAGTHKLQCVSYSPYYKDGMNPTVADTFVDPLQIEADMQALSKVTDCVRTYSVSQGMDYVPKAAQKLGMKVILGAWIGWIDATNKKELELAIQQANQYPNTVRGVVVGNEVLLRGEQTEAKMHEYLQWAKANTKAPITYADVWEFWLKYPLLEQEVDFITVHILPYWEDLPVAVELAVQHTGAIMGQLGATFKKPILIGETGWPSQGRQRFRAIPSVVNQAKYVRSFLQAAHQAGWQYNIIEAVDQPWKRQLEGTVGGYWGVLDESMTPKFALHGAVPERSDGWRPYALSLLLAVIAVAWSVSRKQTLGQHLLLAVTLATAGLHAYLQVEYVHMAARGALEYLMLGGLLLLGWALLLLQLRQWLGCKPAACMEQGLLRLLALALLLTSAGLAVNGRYLDFPLILAGLPVAAILVSLLHVPAIASAEPSAHSVGLWLTMVMVLLSANAAVAVAMMEPGNLTAWWWAGLCGLALFVLPARSMQLTRAGL